MGDTFEVWAWIQFGLTFEYEKKYSGESYRKAIATMKRLKKDGVGCVKFYWR